VSGEVKEGASSWGRVVAVVLPLAWFLATSPLQSNGVPTELAYQWGSCASLDWDRQTLFPSLSLRCRLADLPDICNQNLPSSSCNPKGSESAGKHAKARPTTINLSSSFPNVPKTLMQNTQIRWVDRGLGFALWCLEWRIALRLEEHRWKGRVDDHGTWMGWCGPLSSWSRCSWMAKVHDGRNGAWTWAAHSLSLSLSSCLTRLVDDGFGLAKIFASLLRQNKLLLELRMELRGWGCKLEQSATSGEHTEWGAISTVKRIGKLESWEQRPEEILIGSCGAPL